MGGGGKRLVGWGRVSGIPPQLRVTQQQQRLSILKKIKSEQSGGSRRFLSVFLGGGGGGGSLKSCSRDRSIKRHG